MAVAQNGSISQSPRETGVSDEVYVDTSLIPDEVRDRLAMVTLECFREFIRNPENVKFLNERIAARKAAQAAK